MAATCIISCRPLDGPGMVYTEEKLPYEQQQAFNELFRAALYNQLNNKSSSAYELYRRALQINPDAPEVLYELSMFNYTMQSMYDSTKTVLADSLLLRAIELAPKNLEYRKEYADIMIERKNFKAALPIYEELAYTKPYSTEKMARLMELYEAVGEYEKALQTAAELEEKEGYDEELLTTKLRNYINLKDTAKAYSMLNELRRKHAGEVRYDALLAEVYIQYNDTARAGAFLKSINAEESDNHYLQISLAHYLDVVGNDSQKRKVLQKVAVNPSVPEGFRIEIMDGILDKAKTYADSAFVYSLIKQNLNIPLESSSMGRFGMYVSMMLSYPRDSMNVMMRSIVKYEPTHVISWVQLIYNEMSKGNFAEAHRLTLEARKYNPDDLIFYSLEAQSLQESKDMAGALEAIRKGEELIKAGKDPDGEVDFLTACASVLANAGDRKGAVEKYKRAYEKDSTDILLLNNYAYDLSVLGEDLEHAEEMSRKTIEKNPEEPMYLDTYAWVLYKLGRFKEAREYIDKAIKFSEEDLSAIYFDHAGDIYLKCGDRKKAQSFWQAALELEHDADMDKSLRKKLKTNKR